MPQACFNYCNANNITARLLYQCRQVELENAHSGGQSRHGAKSDSTSIILCCSHATAHKFVHYKQHILLHAMQQKNTETNIVLLLYVIAFEPPIQHIRIPIQNAIVTRPCTQGNPVMHIRLSINSYVAGLERIQWWAQPYTHTYANRR